MKRETSSGWHSGTPPSCNLTISERPFKRFANDADHSFEGASPGSLHRSANHNAPTYHAFDEDHRTDPDPSASQPSTPQIRRSPRRLEASPMRQQSPLKKERSQLKEERYCHVPRRHLRDGERMTNTRRDTSKAPRGPVRERRTEPPLPNRRFDSESSCTAHALTRRPSTRMRTN